MRAKILLVEDDPTIIDTLTELLRGAGYTVDTADTQREAIAMATHQTYQLLLLDVTLKQGNGFAVCAAVKEATPEVPVIFLTASDDEFNTVTGLTMGADDYIAKPFRPRELLAAAPSQAGASSRSATSRSTPTAPLSSATARKSTSRHSSTGCCFCSHRTPTSWSRVR